MASTEQQRILAGRRWPVLVLTTLSLSLLCFIPGNLLQPATQAQVPPAYERTVKLVAVGDIMAHLPLVKGAYDPVSRQHDFMPVFADLKPVIAAADVAIGNLETTLTAGHDYTGYPRFRAPAALARDLGKTGFDVLVTANNHSLDYGAAGVLDTLEVLKQNGLRAVGTAAASDAVGPVLIERNGIRLAFVAYATALNGFSLPAKRDYLVRLYSPETVRADVAAAKAAGADLIVCYIHFGEEYLRYPDVGQYRIADDLLAAGVDVLLGSHAHVVQPEQKPAPRGGYAIYSLGNFVSSQRSRFTDVGVLLEIEITKHYPEGCTEVRRVKPVPTYVRVQRVAGRSRYRVLPLQQVDAEASARYLSQLTYNRDSLYYDMLGHLQGGVWRPSSPPQVPQAELVAQLNIKDKR